MVVLLVPFVVSEEADDCALPNAGTVDAPEGMRTVAAVASAGSLSEVDDLKLKGGRVWVLLLVDVKLKLVDGLLAPKAKPANGLGFGASSLE